MASSTRHVAKPSAAIFPVANMNSFWNSPFGSLLQGARQSMGRITLQAWQLHASDAEPHFLAHLASRPPSSTEHGPASSRDDYQLTTIWRLLQISSTDVSSVLNTATLLTSQALGASAVEVRFPDPHTGRFTAARSAGIQQARPSSPEMHSSLTETDRTAVDSFRSGRAMLIQTAPSEGRHGEQSAADSSNEMVCPLGVGNERRGILYARTKEAPFVPPDLRFLEAVSGVIGLLVHRCELVGQIAELTEPRNPRNAQEELARITPRQREVVRLIAEGLTNKQIASRLILEHGTVTNHVQAILTRLGFERRTQVATWAVSIGLGQSEGAGIRVPRPSPGLPPSDGSDVR